MAMGQNLYAQVVKLRRKCLKFVATDKNKNEAKFKFQDQTIFVILQIDLET